jgi:hypothetical protein
LFEVEHAADCDDSGNFIPNEVDRVREAFGGGEAVGAEAFSEELRRLDEHGELRLDSVYEIAANPVERCSYQEKLVSISASASGAMIKR